MQYEIDFLPVGEGKRGGDALVLRYGDFTDRSKYKVVVIDGGTKDAGKNIVDHIQQYFHTDRVDMVVATHLHSDHTSGLTEVLENLHVDKLIMHLPWSYTDSLQKMTTTKASKRTLETKLEKSISTISNLQDLALEKNVPIEEAFAGDFLLDGDFIVLGPSKEYYEQLLANFGTTPDVKKEYGLLEDAKNFLKEAIEWVEESFDKETLDDDYEDTTPENNSSLVLLFKFNGKRILFTGDAGKDALNRVIDYSELVGEDLKYLDLLDVPHHGSKRNLGPTILDHFKPSYAFISCPPDGDPKHPSRKVKNALIRRDCKVALTKLKAIHIGDGPKREGWGPISLEEFSAQVEK